jgi:hypothetical protein
MKGVAVLLCILLVIKSSGAAPARKLAADDGQQTGETQTKTEGYGRMPRTNDGNHHCTIPMLPCCSPKLGKVGPNCRR